MRISGGFCGQTEPESLTLGSVKTVGLERCPVEHRCIMSSGMATFMLKLSESLLYLSDTRYSLERMLRYLEKLKYFF